MAKIVISVLHSFYHFFLKEKTVIALGISFHPSDWGTWAPLGQKNNLAKTDYLCPPQHEVMLGARQAYSPAPARKAGGKEGV